MKRSGSADLSLMGGSIPNWLFDRITKLSLPIVESIVLEFGKQEFLRKLPYVSIQTFQKGFNYQDNRSQRLSLISLPLFAQSFNKSLLFFCSKEHPYFRGLMVNDYLKTCLSNSWPNT